MKAPKYILKRVYLERNAEREYKNHQKRLEKIKSQPTNFFKDSQKLGDILEKANQKHLRAIKYKDLEKSREENFVNNVLINKLLEINEGRYAVAKNPNESQQSLLSTNLQKSIQTTTNKASNSIASVGRKFEHQRIQQENQALAQRILKLPPVVSKQKQEQDFVKSQYLRERILRFHYLKEKKEPKYNRMPIDDWMDPFQLNDKELMDQKVHVLITFKKIRFINFIPTNNDQNEKYFLEIKASIKSLRRTTPEVYENFAKSVINEFFFLSQLKQNKVIYVGLWQLKYNTTKKKGQEPSTTKFLGDFELDLSPYYLDECSHEIHIDLRNYKELKMMPNYMPKDMRKKGQVDFELKVRSHIRQFCIESKRIDESSLKELQKFYDEQQKILQGEALPNSEEETTQQKQENQDTQIQQPQTQRQ